MTSPAQKNILVTGVTGYIGGRLVPRLLEKGYHVRILVRDQKRLQGRDWLQQVEVIEGDVLEPDTLQPAMQDIDTAYYLIHSMGGGDSFYERDEQAARNFGSAASDAGVKRLIYLGGLGDPETDLSLHLRSRQHVGDVLRDSGVPVTEFRAAVIVGSGSISFEMIRYLTERLPVMICPQWVFTRIQPISIRDTLQYLIDALDTPFSTGRIIEIGGENVLTYGEMMLGYAEARNLRRYLLPVPVLTPRLSSYWVHLVTPIPASIARPLIDGLHNEVIVRDDSARHLFPHIQPMDYRTAVQLSLSRLRASEIETTWSDALVSSMGDIKPYSFEEREGMMIERMEREIQAPPADVYRAFARLGGGYGWLYLNGLWHIRGLLDRLVGGPGYRRGRRDPDILRVGEALDFWRVEAIEPNRLLRLRAEMKLPGRGWLQFEAEPMPNGSTRLIQTAFFASRGLLGLVYWYGLFFVHSLIFTGLINQLVIEAERINESGSQVPSDDRSLRQTGLVALGFGVLVGLLVVVKTRKRD
ncbi:MAG: NAD(P)-dependent oxidoreductase [Anaerolineaceae bacterium]|nr:NAD(P)-dependent oxidoreductase [Anaerolineaceae bacterium]